MKSMFDPRMWWPLFLVGCSASSPAVTGGVGATDRPTDAVKIDALRSRLPVPPVGAFVRPGGKLFPSPALQPAPQPKRFVADGMDFGRGFKLVENQGGALKLAVQGGNLEIEVFVAREQLLPVLAEEVGQAFADGSGYVACPGLLVGLVEDRVVVAAPALSELPIQFPESKVALGFENRECSRLPPLPQESELACVAGKPLEALPPPSEFATPHSNCGVRDWAEELPRPTLNGAPLESSIVPLVWSSTVHRHADHLLISMWLPESPTADRARLQLRVVGRPNHVMDRTGMGTLGRGGARGPSVRSGAAVYFHDGTLAGRYVGPGIMLEDEPAGSRAAAATDSGNVCIVAPVEGGLCFARADLVTAEERDRRSVVSLGDVTVGEGRTVSQVTSVVSRYLPGFQGCHDKALRAGSSSTGEVVVDFTILDFGEVTSVSAENHLPDAEVAACITRILKLIRFPALDRPLFPPPAKEIPVAVRVPLVLRVAPRKP